MKTVIEMAREAGGMDGWGGRGKRSDPELKSDEFVFDPEDLERFAALVRADEREALAQPEQMHIEKNMTLACPSYLHDYTTPPQRKPWVDLSQGWHVVEVVGNTTKVWPMTEAQITSFSLAEPPEQKQPTGKEIEAEFDTFFKAAYGIKENT